MPFQVWAPDVYQGAPTPVAAFLSAGPKAAAFAVFVRIFFTALEPIGLEGVIAGKSLYVGSFTVAEALQTLASS